MTPQRLMAAAERRFGVGVKRTNQLNRFLAHHGVDLLIDVGANVGQFGREVRDRGYAGEILSFEPISTVFGELKAEIGDDPLWKARQSALGSSAGSADINVSEFTVFSSMRRLNDTGLEFDNRARAVRTETVEVARLDEVMASIPAQQVFLKIDTQGFEREVLLGATDTLKRCIGVQLELAAEHIYDKIWPMHEAIAFMNQEGFIPAQFKPVNPRKDDPTSALEFDCIFRRK